MSAGPVARTVRGGLTRRRVQVVVIGVVLLVSTAASVTALALVADSSSPFDHAFAAQRGAQVAMAVNSVKAADAQLAATRRLPGVTAAAGPFGEVTSTPRITGPLGGQLTLPPVTLAGRASQGGPVDDLVLQSGHWATRPGQVVLASGSQDGQQIGVPLGSRITLSGLRGHWALTVVGTANSVTGSAGGWVTPGEIARLRAAGAPASAQMLYRFASAGTAAAIRTDVAEVTRALPAGAVTGMQSYLAARFEETGNIAPFVPFLVAFGVIGLVMSVLIVGNVVSGAVVAGYRRIGILKSIGFTPGQVVTAYTGLAAVPALAGCLAGVVLGNVLAAPLLAQNAGVYGVGSLSVPAWVNVAVPAAMLCLVGIAAVLPALRAGRLSAVAAIAAGHAPRSGRGYGAHRLLGRLRLPRPVTIGLAAPFARPARTAVTLLAVLLGATAVTFAVGLTTSLKLVVAGLSHDKAEPVLIQLPSAAGPGLVVHPGPSGSHHGPAAHPPGGQAPDAQARGTGHGTVAGHQPSPAAQQRAVEAALRAQPGTQHYVAQATQLVSAAGLAQQTQVTAFRGNASWTGYEMISGHWYRGPGQVDVATGFLTATGAAIGDTVTITVAGHRIPVRIVGEIFDTENNGLAMFTGWQTLARTDRGLAADQYDVGLKPGYSAQAYSQAVSSRLGSDYFVSPNSRRSDELDLMIALIGTLTLLLGVVAGLGVLNTVLLSTRERVHDLGVFKAVGMTPRQTIAMVVCWVAGTGLVAGLLAVPAGIELHRYVLPAMAGAADVGLPASILNVYGPAELAGLALAGLLIAAAGALLPAGWAAATRTATALHAE